MKVGKWTSVLALSTSLIWQQFSEAQEFYNNPVPTPPTASFGSPQLAAAADYGYGYGNGTPYSQPPCVDCNSNQVDRPSRLANVYAGYSFAFTKLHLKESFEAQVLDFATFTQTLVPFDYDYELTPRVWLGARNERGLGFRTSYWNYDHQSNGFQFTNSTGFQVPAATSTSVIFPATIAGSGFGDTLTVNSSVKASTLDFEGTYLTNIGALSSEFGGGLRYARSDQNSEASVIPGPVGRAASLNWQRVFEGFGPTFSANGTVPIGRRGFYGVGGANASFLFGEKAIRRTVVNDSTPPPNNGLPRLLFEEADEISGIYGLRIGMGHRRRTFLGDAYVEGTYEGQLWTDLGAPTLTFAGFNSLSVNLGLTF